MSFKFNPEETEFWPRMGRSGVKSKKQQARKFESNSFLTLGMDTNREKVETNSSLPMCFIFQPLRFRLFFFFESLGEVMILYAISDRFHQAFFRL